MFSVLQGTIRNVYRELKMVAHVILALKVIDNIVKYTILL